MFDGLRVVLLVLLMLKVGVVLLLLSWKLLFEVVMLFL